MNYEKIYWAIQSDPRYLDNLDWGAPRSGHPEGTVRAHIVELERNLKALRGKLSEADFWKLKILIHTHDTFKADAKLGVAITHPRSHASLAREFLATFTDDADLLAMVQFHDEPYALWRQLQSRGHCDRKRLDALLAGIRDWNLFLALSIIDGCTEGKSREPVHWLLQEMTGKVTTCFSAQDIL